MNSFWQDLRRDGRFLRVQAPMEGLSDTAFRTWLCRNAAPDVYYTEFSSAKGLLQGHADTLRRLKHEPGQDSTMRPLVAQLWGNDSAEMAPALEELHRRGFSGVDLNFGCPHKKIIAKPAGSGLLQLEHQHRALAMLQECLNARASGFVPPNFGISVKTRLGFERIDWDFLAQLLQLSASVDHSSSDRPEEKQKQKQNQKKIERGLDALIVHFRLAVVPKKHINHKDNLRWARFSAALPQSLQDGPCYWQYSHKLRDLRDLLRPQTLLIGNGGLAPWRGADWQDAEATGLDGWMAARALFDDPLYFRRGKRNVWPELPLEQRLTLLHEHLLLYRELVEPGTTQPSFSSEIPSGTPSNIRPDSAAKGSRIELYEIFKKFYRIYLPNTGPSQKREESLRHALQQSQNLQAALEIIGNIG